MIEVAYTNIQCKTKINGLLLILYPCMRSSSGVSTFMLLYITVVEILTIFINADKRIKGVQIGDHETKQYILLMTPFF